MRELVSSLRPNLAVFVGCGQREYYNLDVMRLTFWIRRISQFLQEPKIRRKILDVVAFQIEVYKVAKMPKFLGNGGEVVVGKGQLG